MMLLCCVQLSMSWMLLREPGQALWPDSQQML